MEVPSISLTATMDMLMQSLTTHSQKLQRKERQSRAQMKEEEEVEKRMKKTSNMKTIIVIVAMSSILQVILGAVLFQFFFTGPTSSNWNSVALMENNDNDAVQHVDWEVIQYLKSGNSGLKAARDEVDHDKRAHNIEESRVALRDHLACVEEKDDERGVSTEKLHTGQLSQTGIISDGEESTSTKIGSQDAYTSSDDESASSTKSKKSSTIMFIMPAFSGEFELGKPLMDEFLNQGYNVELWSSDAIEGEKPKYCPPRECPGTFTTQPFFSDKWSQGMIKQFANTMEESKNDADGFYRASTMSHYKHEPKEDEFYKTKKCLLTDGQFDDVCQWERVCPDSDSLQLRKKNQVQKWSEKKVEEVSWNLSLASIQTSPDPLFSKLLERYTSDDVALRVVVANIFLSNWVLDAAPEVKNVVQLHPTMVYWFREMQSARDQFKQDHDLVELWTKIKDPAVQRPKDALWKIRDVKKLPEHAHLLNFPEALLNEEQKKIIRNRWEDTDYCFGPLMSQNQSELPKLTNKKDIDVMNWIKKDNRPIIFVSFGSQVQKLKKLAENLITIFNMMNKDNREYRILASFKEVLLESYETDDVKVTSWVPQLHVLAHENVKMFFSHCGAGSMNESLTFGKPIVPIAFWDDQFYHAKALAEKKLASEPLDKFLIHKFDRLDEPVKAEIVRAVRSRIEQACSEDIQIQVKKFSTELTSVNKVKALVSKVQEKFKLPNYLDEDAQLSSGSDSDESAKCRKTKSKRVLSEVEIDYQGSGSTSSATRLPSQIDHPHCAKRLGSSRSTHTMQKVNTKA